MSERNDLLQVREDERFESKRKREMQKEEERFEIERNKEMREEDKRFKRGMREEDERLRGTEK